MSNDSGPATADYSAAAGPCPERISGNGSTVGEGPAGSRTKKRPDVPLSPGLISVTRGPGTGFTESQIEFRGRPGLPVTGRGGQKYVRMASVTL
jgi:hypothetical protein